MLAGAGMALKIETDGSRIDEAADRLARCVGAFRSPSTGQLRKPRGTSGSSFVAATDAIRRLAARGLSPQLVFVPNRLNIDEIDAAFELAVALGCGAFVTGPMMRIGRAAMHWDEIACSEAQWEEAVGRLRELSRADARTALSIYPWDIVTEMERRLEHPQAMLLVVPNARSSS